MGDLGKIIVAKGLKKLPKVQKIAKSGHTVWRQNDQRIGRQSVARVVMIVGWMGKVQGLQLYNIPSHASRSICDLYLSSMLGY